MEHIYSLYNTADVLYRVLRSNNLAEQIVVNGVVPMEPKIYSIVLVDDSPAILTLAGWLLREEGYEVYPFTRALAAFEFIAQHPVHLVISDLKMPSMDGLAFAQALREADWNGIFIFMSGHRCELNPAALKKLRISRVIPKPFDLVELSDCVSEALREPCPTP